jgi:hypothetical protein
MYLPKQRLPKNDPPLAEAREACMTAAFEHEGMSRIGTCPSSHSCEKVPVFLGGLAA